MRNATTNEMGREITKQYRAFDGTKTEFMAQLEGVTDDQRSDPTYVNPLAKHIKQLDLLPAAGSYYCTIVRNGALYEVYSYGEDDWFCKC